MGFLTFTCLVAIAVGVVTRRWGVPLAIGASTTAGVSAVIGGIGIPTFFTVALAAVVWAVFDAVHRRWQGRPALAPLRCIPGAIPLIVFCVWAVLTTFIASFVFAGTVLISPVDQTLAAGVITSRNVAQISYLLIGVGVVILLARSRDARPGILGLALALSMGLSFWRFLAQQYGLPFPEGVFDNSPTFVFIETAPGGAPRFRGIFPEPASLATIAVLAIVYGLIRSFQVGGARRVGCWLLVAVSAIMGFASTSTTFVIAGVAIALIALLTQAFAFLSRRLTFGVGAGLIACLLVIVAAVALPAIAQALSATVEDKVGTFSYQERSSVDQGLMESFEATGGFGVGLGAARGSSFVVTMLSTVGLVGTVLLATAIVIIVRRSQYAREYSPVLWSLISLLVVKTISGPELSDSHGLLWVCLGLLAHAALRRAPQGSASHRRISSDALRI